MQDKENRLLELFRGLPETEACSVLDFAEFLAARDPQLKSVVVPTTTIQSATVNKVEPVIIPRPDSESVIAAVKRLSASYPMLGKDTMLNATADLVSHTIMGGRDIIEAIDELEEIFSTQYQLHIESK